MIVLPSLHVENRSYTPMIVLALFCYAYGWGIEGHSIVAYIAENLLLPDSLVLAKKILNATLDEIADWADSYRHTHEGAWSTKLHFADLPDDICLFNEIRDCNLDGCVFGAIGNYTNRLSFHRDEESLKFLVHFVGDAHQPLHVGHIGDRGGNEIKVTTNFSNHSFESNHETNLHEVWDGVILKQSQLESSHSSWQEKANQLLQAINGKYSEIADKFANDCYQDIHECILSMVVESGNKACSNAYYYSNNQLIKSGDHLGREYYEKNIDLIDLRLIAGGIRLAALIEMAFHPDKRRRLETQNYFLDSTEYSIYTTSN
jgi:S1/P1 Nuclease